MIFKNIFSNSNLLNDFLFHIILLFTISLNLTISYEIIDFTTISCLVIYIYNNKKINWYTPFIIFLWGIYQDLIIGFPLGYSSLLFLFFLLLSQLINNLRPSSITISSFFVYIVGVILFLSIEYIIIFINFDISLSITYKLLNLVIASLIYFPAEYLKTSIMNYYEKE